MLYLCFSNVQIGTKPICFGIHNPNTANVDFILSISSFIICPIAQASELFSLSHVIQSSWFLALMILDWKCFWSLSFLYDPCHLPGRALLICFTCSTHITANVHAYDGLEPD